MKKLLGKVQNHFNKLSEFARQHLLAAKHASELQLTQDNLSHISPKDIILFSTMKNETFRLPYFLQYYRDLGVNHFIFIDNDSDDGMMELLKEDDDVSVYYTSASYKDSFYGVHWINYLLRIYGTGHWCLTCDPDEFLVFPYMENRNLHALTEYLDSTEKKSFFAPLIDMYSDKPVDETSYEAGTDPLESCPYFDKVGYTVDLDYYYRNQWIQGGVRRRIFNAKDPQKSPALNKVPLIKWEKHYSYLESTHRAIPRELNTHNNPSATTGALLHFKFMSSIIEKIAVEMEAKQHWDDSYEYVQYGKAIDEKQYLYDEEVSIKFENWHSLEKLGLINRGEWR